jgi:SAM-dependent methyltransferase
MTTDTIPAPTPKDAGGLKFRERVKWTLFPGLNLHARLRYRRLPEHFRGPSNGAARTVLDAGCGNGMLCYQSYLKGNTVLGVSIKEGEIARNRKLFNEFHGIPEERLSFRVHNLYEIESLGMEFDEIICTEVMEHIERDSDVCGSFFRMLKPGGVLHLCCPNADHPDHQAHLLDEDEAGGHVRAGYTEQTYRDLLEPIGFEVSKPIGLGGGMRQACNKRITQAQYIGRLPLGMVTFAALAPLASFERGEPKVPYSLYVQATKPTE